MSKFDIKMNTCTQWQISYQLFCHSCCNAFHCHQWFLLINNNIPRDHWSFKQSYKATHHTSHQGTKPSEISYGIAKSARKSKRHPDVTETSPWMTSDQPNMPNSTFLATFFVLKLVERPHFPPGTLWKIEPIRFWREQMSQIWNANSDI